MSVANEIQRIVNAKKEIAGKIAEMGLQYYDDETKSHVTVSVDDDGNPNDTIDELAEALDSIEVAKPSDYAHNVVAHIDPDTGILSAQVLFPSSTVFKEEDYGWIDGSVTEQLDVYEGETIVPTKNNQHIADPGTYTISSIDVAPIPDNYVDVSEADASPSQVVGGVKFVGANGVVEEGTMTNRGAIDVKLNTSAMPLQLYKIPEGYHDGNGKVTWEFTSRKTITPTKETQEVWPELNTMGISLVVVNPIPYNYADTSSGDAVEGEILKDKKAWVDGVEVTGTMPVNVGGAIYLGNSEDGFIDSYEIPVGYHDGSGTVYINFESKTATPTKEKQEFTPQYGGAFSKFTVDPIPDNYVDVSGISKDSDDLTVDEHTVNVPAGYYPKDAQAIVPKMDILHETIDVFAEPVGTDEGGNVLFVMNDVNRYVKKISIGIDHSLEEALAAI